MRSEIAWSYGYKLYISLMLTHLFRSMLTHSLGVWI